MDCVMSCNSHTAHRKNTSPTKLKTESMWTVQLLIDGDSAESSLSEASPTFSSAQGEHCSDTHHVLIEA